MGIKRRETNRRRLERKEGGETEEERRGGKEGRAKGEGRRTMMTE